MIINITTQSTNQHNFHYVDLLIVIIMIMLIIIIMIMMATITMVTCNGRTYVTIDVNL